VSGKQKELIVGGQGMQGKKNYEPITMSWGCVGFHPIQKIPKRDFWDGALVGVGSLKLCSSKSTISLQP